jgi:hypothetical protein
MATSQENESLEMAYAAFAAAQQGQLPTNKCTIHKVSFQQLIWDRFYFPNNLIYIFIFGLCSGSAPNVLVTT